MTAVRLQDLMVTLIINGNPAPIMQHGRTSAVPYFQVTATSINHDHLYRRVVVHKLVGGALQSISPSVKLPSNQMRKPNILSLRIMAVFHLFKYNSCYLSRPQRCLYVVC
ncbi:hypothetical protein CS542_03225 [Pedobacter sp. IW39]|nr:hypothetical protein CS542_03225 [Pedobacter sp. IW39]